MSTEKKAKTKAAAKRRPTNLREARKTKPKLATHSAALEGPTGRFWTQWIEPKGAALLSQTLMPIHFVIKNYASHTIKLVAQYGDLMDLAPGAVRATYASDIIRVENPDAKSSALIEFDFLPILRK